MFSAIIKQVIRYYYYLKKEDASDQILIYLMYFVQKYYVVEYGTLLFSDTFYVDDENKLCIRKGFDDYCNCKLDLQTSASISRTVYMFYSYDEWYLNHLILNEESTQKAIKLKQDIDYDLFINEAQKIMLENNEYYDEIYY